MTFLHVSLLAGGLMAVLPVLMHMLGRRQPKTIVFPAIRFVRQTAIHAQRGWSIKRWLLLAMRVMMLMLLALALASPRVPSAMFATYLVIGVIGVMALLATAVAVTSLSSGKKWQITWFASAIALLLWGTGGTWLAMALGNGQPVPMTSSSGPICAVVIVDTSPTMGYRYHNKTRLEVAKEMAMWLMDRLPSGSHVAIVNNDIGIRLSQDRLSANRQLERTKVEGRAANLISRISTSIDVLRQSELERREIYVLTDMSSPAWREAQNSDIPAKLVRNEDGTGKVGNNVLLQVVDVGVPVKSIRDWSINDLKLSQQTTIPGGQVSLTADVQSAIGSGNEQLTVELALEEIDRRAANLRDVKASAPTMRVVDRQLIEVPEGGSIPVHLTLKDLPEGTNHAELRLIRSDPLEVNNVLYLSIEARSQGQTLVVSDDLSDGQLVSLIVDPFTDPRVDLTPKEDKSNKEDKSTDKGASPTNVLATWEPTSRLGAVDLAKYSSIVLFNPSKMDADVADKLEHWVERGGGLMIVLGPGYPSAEALMDSPLSTLLPGKVKRLTRRTEDSRSIFLAPVIANHPIWSVFERSVEEVPWGNYAVFFHWDLESLNEHAVTLMRYTESEQPALIEELRKQGRIITWTTPYPSPSAATRKPWNELYSGVDPWPAYALFTASLRHLAAWNKQRLNYFVDQIAVLENNAAQFPQTYELHTPQEEVVRVEASDESLTYAFTRFPGQYRIRGLRPQGPVIRGFSVNVDRQDTSLERIDNKILEVAFGKDNYLVAREREEVQSSLGEGRYGRDLSPFLLVITVLLIMAEQTMSSRFYAQTKRSGE